MNTPYLNPVELFGLTDRTGLKTTDLRKAKKRFLTELELDGREDFEYYGRLYTRHDLEQAGAHLQTEENLIAYQTAAGIAGLTDFLTTERLSGFLDHQQLFNPRLKPLLKDFFAPAYGRAYGRAVQTQDVPTLKQLTAWKPELLGLRESTLYGDAFQEMDRRVNDFKDVVEAYRMDPKSPGGRPLRGMKAFKDAFPKELMWLLPEYFQDISNRLVAEILPFIISLNNDKNDPRVALALNRSLLDLPHLTEVNRKELIDIGKQLRTNVSAGRAVSSGGDGPSTGRVIWLVIVFVIMLFRVGSCMSRTSNNNYSYSPHSYQNQNYLPKNQDLQKMVKEFRVEAETEFADELRKRVCLGQPIHLVEINPIMGLPSSTQQQLQQVDANVYDANLALNQLYVDTLVHHNGKITAPEQQLMALSLDELKTLLQNENELVNIDAYWQKKN